MESSHLVATTRLYTDMGSVFAKMLANGASFTVFSYDPGAGRVKAKAAKLGGVRREASWMVKTDSGSYFLGANQALRALDGRVIPVRDLKPGTPLYSCDLQNAEGDIYIQTGKELIPLFQLIESDLETGFTPTGILSAPSSYQSTHVQTVIEVKEAESADGYPVEIECPSPKGFGPYSGHNFLIWPDGTSFGSGIFAY